MQIDGRPIRSKVRLRWVSDRPGQPDSCCWGGFAPSSPTLASTSQTPLKFTTAPSILCIYRASTYRTAPNRYRQQHHDALNNAVAITIVRTSAYADCAFLIFVYRSCSACARSAKAGASENSDQTPSSFPPLLLINNATLASFSRFDTFNSCKTDSFHYSHLLRFHLLSLIQSINQSNFFFFIWLLPRSSACVIHRSSRLHFIMN